MGVQKDSMDAQLHGRTETDGAQKGYAFQATDWVTMRASWSERLTTAILAMVTLDDEMGMLAANRRAAVWSATSRRDNAS